MMRILPSLERRLRELFPKERDLERFVNDAVLRALDEERPSFEEQPEAIGGTLHLFTDGASRGNPGQAAIACILEDPLTGKIIREHAERIGIETNNVAEYRALIEGLKLAKRYYPLRLVCHLDAELIVKQLKGEYRVKMPTLQPLVEEIKELASSLPNVSFHHIPRSDNHRADALANRILDAHPSPPYEGGKRK